MFYVLLPCTLIKKSDRYWLFISMSRKKTGGYQSHRSRHLLCDIWFYCSLVGCYCRNYQDVKWSIFISSTTLCMKQVHKIVLLEISSCKELQPDAKLWETNRNSDSGTENDRYKKKNICIKLIFLFDANYLYLLRHNELGAKHVWSLGAVVFWSLRERYRRGFGMHGEK